MEKYFLVGIKGTGMASLACILKDLGYEVSGSDLAKHFFPEDKLRERQIPIYTFEDQLITSDMTVIIGNAFADDFFAVEQAYQICKDRCYRYHVFIGKLMQKYHSISIAGSHGKTTTTGLVAAMLNYKMPTGYLIGDGEGSISKDASHFVLESCEFRRHFLAYHPDYAVITNIEIDHVDYYKDVDDYNSAYVEFSNNVKKKLIVYGDDINNHQLAFKQAVIWYGLNQDNDLRAYNIEMDGKGIRFDVDYLQEFFGHFDLPLVGKHLLLDALAAIGIGIMYQMSPVEIETGLSSFKGVKRRFIVKEIGDNIFIDDYAHHPTEISVTLDSVKLRYPERKIVAIFKPHRASRVKYFVNEFVAALSKADIVGVCDFTSIDDFDDGSNITINYLTDRIKNCYVFHETEDEAQVLATHQPAVFVFMSSKDIYPFMDKVIKHCGK